MSILSINRVHLSLANQVILDEVSWQIEPRERVAIVGRNGAGKSTLLRLLQGELTPDSGQVQRLNGLRVAGLTQEVPVNIEGTVYDFVVSGLGETAALLSAYQRALNQGDMDKISHTQQEIDRLHLWDLLPRIEMVASRLDLNLTVAMTVLSGGMKRRALLAAAIVAEPDLLLLDEPTNHLDIGAIEWLESYLKTYNGSVVLVTHDRTFLSRVANQIVEVDRGKLNRFECDYETFLTRREALRSAEDKANDLFDKRLADEEVWIRTGVKARRTRNEGRVRALEAMREAHKSRRAQAGTVQKLKLDTSLSGQLVLEAEAVNYSIPEKQLLKDFSLLLMRGDKIGIIGPNGSGKTTLLRLLLGDLTPDSGKIRQGTNLSIAYFDQLRRHLDEKETVMQSVGEGADYVTINGNQKHVASYLKEFLFSSDRFNQPVSSLSGGERNRLLLAKLFAKPVNLLVMDEPTNDLDIETLELLEDILTEYKGTLLLISHDRKFIDEVVTSVLVYEGDGCFNEYVGGYQAYTQEKEKPKRAAVAPASVAAISAKKPVASAPIKLTYQEQRELSSLPKQIEGLEATIAGLHLEMTEPAFYEKNGEQIATFNRHVAEQEKQLANYYERWEHLESKKEGG